MIQQEHDGIEILKKKFDKIKKNRPGYSLRSFARDLNIHPATLSSILKGRRNFPQTHVLDIATRLRLTKAERNLFIRSCGLPTSSKRAELQLQVEAQGFQLDERDQLHHRIISKWQYYAVLSLLEINDTWTFEKIQNRFSLKHEDAQTILNDLVRAGFITLLGSQYQLSTNQNLQTSSDIPSQVLRDCHLDELQIAAERLKQVDEVSKRDYSSHTMAIDPKNLPKAKALIRNFRKQLADLLESGDQSEVYLLSLQLFPLTKEETNS